MVAEIITIGDELLIGQVVDTNSAWMAKQLNMAGISIKQIVSVADDSTAIMQALDNAKTHADIILITGGLGPTKDDLTKNTLCRYFKTELIFNERVYENVERLFRSLGKEVTPVNRRQAEVPANCIPLHNKWGTAPGMWFEADGKIFVSLPGVPYEMKGLMSEKVLPELKKRFQLPHIIHKTIITQGIGESFLAQIIERWEEGLPPYHIKLAYLPSPGLVRLRLSAKGENKEELSALLDKKIRELKQLIAPYFFGFEEYGKEDQGLPALIGRMLKERGKTLSTAESCTGGHIAHLVTSVAGSSAYYKGSVIAYANDIKTLELNVPPAMLEKYGAVSREVAECMASGIRKKFSTDYSIAVTGIAGPEGGSDEKPVGTVWIAVADAEKTTAEKFLFGNSRERNIQKSANAAFNMLRKMLEG